MIASVRELGIGSDHAGILVLPPHTAEPGDDALPLIGANDPVIELNITPDRGYAFSVRGLAREIATATDVDYVDPASRVAVPDVDGDAWPVTLADEGCSAVRRPPRGRSRPDGGVAVVDAAAPARRRDAADLADRRRHQLRDAGAGPAAARLRRGAAVRARSWCGGRRRARPSPPSTTSQRRLDPDDLLITDDSGPIGLAGVMGGASTEIRPGTEPIDVVIEAAHFDPATIARGARRHKLPSEASRRFERTVDPQLPPVAAERVAHAAGRARRRHDRGRSHRRGRRAAAPRPCGWRWIFPTAWRAWPTRREPRPAASARWDARSSSGRARTGAARSSRRRRRGGRISCSPPTSSRRCCGWRATRRSPRSCRPRPRAGASPPRSDGGARCRWRWPRRATSRCCRSRSSGLQRGTRSGWPRTTPAAARCTSEPARRRPRRARHHTAAGPARDARAQPVTRAQGDLALYTVGQVVLPHREQLRAARAGRRPASVRRRDRADRRGAARAAAARRRGAGR